MAVAGSITSAYEFSVYRGALRQISTHYPAARCVKPQEAVDVVKSGGFAIVASSDAFAFRKMWEQSNATLPQGADGSTG